MMQNGYLTSDINSVLVNVTSDDLEKETTLNEAISSNIKNTFISQGFEGVVLNNEITPDEELEVSTIAKNNEISNGKAGLIHDIMLVNPTYTETELSEYSITQLAVLLENLDSSASIITNSTSNIIYITPQEALNIAKNHANVANSQKEKIEFDIEDGIYVYDIEFETELFEFDYYIDAITGSVVRNQKESNDLDDIIENIIPTPAPTTAPVKTPAPTKSPTPNIITADEALAIAKNHSKVSEFTLTKNELDNDDSKLHYEIEFYSNNIKYEYDILAIDGTIISYEKDIEDDIAVSTPMPAPTANTSVNTGYITSNSALEIAKNHAGVSDIYEVENEFDNDDGISIYEIEFKTSTHEYEYDINASTGEIISTDKELND